MTYLHPGTVAAPDTDQEYVVVALDDGDSRDIHFSRVRYLPPGYPLIGKTRLYIRLYAMQSYLCNVLLVL